MLLSVAGILISLLAYLIAFPDPDRRRFDIYFPLLALHLAMTFAYWLYHFEAAMDAFTYYRDPWNFYQGSPFYSGTYFIIHVVQTLKRAFGGSFLDYFLFFQCFGMIGMALLLRSFNEVADSLGVQTPLVLYLVLFIPGLHFWSVAIGKDAPMFMAVALAVWGSIRIRKRLFWIALAVLLMIAIRAHVGAMVLLAGAIAFLMARGVPPTLRVIAIPVLLAGLGVLVFMVGDRLGFDAGDTASVAHFIQTQQNLNVPFGSGADIRSLPFPAKVVTLLFRPVFFDASGVMGMVASLENVVFLLIFGYMARSWRDTFALIRQVYHMVFCAVFSGTLIIALALVNYNIGLGQRQKMMAMPAVLLIFASVYLYRQYRAAAEAAALAAAEDGAEPAGFGAPAKA